MCLIVDANVAALVFSFEPDKSFQPIWEALWKNRAVAVHGGRLTVEYRRIARIRNILLELDRKGVLRKLLDSVVNAAEAEFSDLKLKSDDPHILGLAKVSQVRLLCSRDVALHADFTDTQLLRPAGNVYQNSTHTHLIRKHCGGTPKRRKTRGKKRT